VTGLQTPTVFGYLVEPFSQLLKIHGVNEVSHTEIQTAEPLVLEQSFFEFEMVIAKLKSHKSPCNKEKVPEEWKGSINVSIYKKGDKTLL
jgi:hypothetical protein